MKKRIIKLLIALSLMIVYFIHQYYWNTYSFRYLITNYLVEGTNIIKITPFSRKISHTFNLKCVEKEYWINGERVFADRYGNKLAIIDGQKVKYYKFDEFNIVDIVSNNEYIYMLFNTSPNKNKILKLDKNFNVVDESLNFEGNPRNIVLIEDDIYVVSNSQKKSNDSKSILYRVSTKTMNLENSIYLESMSFVFRISEVDGKLLVFGNYDNIGYKLQVSKFDRNLKLELEKKYTEKALWVNNILKNDKYLIIQNEFSIIFLNKLSLDILNVYKKENCALLDVMKKKNCLYVLSLNIKSGESYIDIVDIKTLKNIKNYKIEIGLEKENDIPSLLMDDF